MKKGHSVVVFSRGTWYPFSFFAPGRITVRKMMMMMMMQAFLCWVAWRNSVWVRHSDYLVFDVLFSYLITASPVVRNTPSEQINDDHDDHDECMGLVSRSVKNNQATRGLRRCHSGPHGHTWETWSQRMSHVWLCCIWNSSASWQQEHNVTSASWGFVQPFKPLVTKVAVSLQCQNLLGNAGKMGGFSETCFSLREIGLFGFSTSKVGYWGSFWKYFQVTVDFSEPHLGPQVNVFGKVVNANQRLWLMRRLGWNFPGKEGISWNIAICSYVWLSHSRLPVGSFPQLKERVFWCNMDPPEKHQDYVDQLRRKVVVHDLWSPRGEAPVSKLSRQTSHLGWWLLWRIIPGLGYVVNDLGFVGPLSRVVGPLPNGPFMAYPLITGMILRVAPLILSWPMPCLLDGFRTPSFRLPGQKT